MSYLRTKGFGIKLQIFNIVIQRFESNISVLNNSHIISQPERYLETATLINSRGATD